MDKPTIEELAIKYLLRHPNDKSDSILAKMRGRFGRKATEDAIFEMIDSVKLLDPTNPNIREFVLQNAFPRKIEEVRRNQMTHDFMERFYGY